jgi:hypothetical protein
VTSGDSAGAAMGGAAKGKNANAIAAKSFTGPSYVAVGTGSFI